MKNFSSKFFPSNFAKPQKHEMSSQLAFTCSKLTIETLEPGVKYVRS